MCITCFQDSIELDSVKTWHPLVEENTDLKLEFMIQGAKLGNATSDWPEYYKNVDLIFQHTVCPRFVDNRIGFTNTTVQMLPPKCVYNLKKRDTKFLPNVANTLVSSLLLNIPASCAALDISVPGSGLAFLPLSSEASLGRKNLIDSRCAEFNQLATYSTSQLWLNIKPSRTRFCCQI